jgi:hypothetical protein
MGMLWISTIMILIILIFCMYYLKKTRMKTKRNKQKDNVVVMLPNESKTQYTICSSTREPQILDNTDVEYYINKRDTVMDSFKRQLLERNLVSIETQDTIQEYIINEIIGETQDTIPRIRHEDFANQGFDNQTVHDTSLQKGLKSKLNTVRGNGGHVNNVEILQFGKSLLEPSKYIKLERVLDTIYSRNSRVTNFNNTETGVLSETWRGSNDTIRKQIINNLVDCYENGHVVCPTGTTSRIVESLYINEPELIPRTNNTYKEEMLNKASIVRRELESTLEFNELPDDAQSKVLAEKLLDTYKNDYKDILSLAQIKEITSDWIDYV